MSNNELSPAFTQDELEHAGRLLKAEIMKLERAIERKKKELEELKPKGFLGGLKGNKDKIKEAEAQLAKLEDELIDLNVMTPTDFLNHLKVKSAKQEQPQEPQTKKTAKPKRKRRDDDDGYDDWDDDDWKAEEMELLSDAKGIMEDAKSDLKGIFSDVKDNIPSGKGLLSKGVGSILENFF